MGFSPCLSRGITAAFRMLLSILPAEETGCFGLPWPLVAPGPFRALRGSLPMRISLSGSTGRRFAFRRGHRLAPQPVCPFALSKGEMAMGSRCSEIYLADRAFRRPRSLWGFRGFAGGGPSVPASSLVLPVYRRRQDSSGVLPFASMSLSRKRLWKQATLSLVHQAGVAFPRGFPVKPGTPAPEPFGWPGGFLLDPRFTSRPKLFGGGFPCLGQGALRDRFPRHPSRESVSSIALPFAGLPAGGGFLRSASSSPVRFLFFSRSSGPFWLMPWGALRSPRSGDCAPSRLPGFAFLSDRVPFGNT